MRITLEELALMIRGNKFDQLESILKSKISNRPITEYIEGTIVADLQIIKNKPTDKRAEYEILKNRLVKNLKNPKS